MRLLDEHEYSDLPMIGLIVLCSPIWVPLWLVGAAWLILWRSMCTAYWRVRRP